MGLAQRTAAWFCFIFFFTPLLTFAVFLQEKEAASVLRSRQKRANSIFEEFRAPSLERECKEEICSYEEAREIFKDERRLKDFWKSYTDPDQCLSNPCLNGGDCIDQYQSYVCTCSEGYEGRNCEISLVESIKCEKDNGQCEQMCRNIPGELRRCDCMDGYTLGEDGTSCIPVVSYPCGQMPVLKVKKRARIVGGEECPKGECPWQARVVLETASIPPRTICGGALIAPDWVITAAHCIKPSFVKRLTAVLGDHKISVHEGTEQTRKVIQVINHENYLGSSGNHDNDIALLRLNSSVYYTDYIVPICLPEAQFAARILLSITTNSVVSGWGRLLDGGATPDTLHRVMLPRVRSQECKNLGMNITDNMFCAGYLNSTKDSCKGDSGGPYTTRYKDTYYLTGIVSWGLGCAKLDTLGVYTRVSRYMEWINKHVNITAN